MGSVTSATEGLSLGPAAVQAAARWEAHVLAEAHTPRGPGTCWPERQRPPAPGGQQHASGPRDRCHQGGARGGAQVRRRRHGSGCHHSLAAPACGRAQGAGTFKSRWHLTRACAPLGIFSRDARGQTWARAARAGLACPSVSPPHLGVNYAGAR